MNVKNDICKVLGFLDIFYQRIFDIFAIRARCRLPKLFWNSALSFPPTWLKIHFMNFFSNYNSYILHAIIY